MCGVPTLWAALAGSVLIGLGLANVVPVLFSAAARVPGIDPGVAISAPRRRKASACSPTYIIGAAAESRSPSYGPCRAGLLRWPSLPLPSRRGPKCLSPA